MELKPGYKRTEGGVIPEDWKTFLISDIALTSSGTTPARASADRYFKNGSIPWVKTLDLNNAEIIKTEECVTKIALTETSLKLFPIGTVLVAMYGGYVQIGRTGLLRMPATVNQAITAIIPENKKLHSVYLLYVLNYRVNYWKLVASSSRKDPNITGNDVKAFPIAVPSASEQQAIATALSDIDALIDGLSKLITKKRDIKQATMQQLLTGKTRLPGFSGEWEEKTLGDVLEKIVGGGTPSRANPAYWNGEIPWVTVKDFATFNAYRAQEYISINGLKNSASNLISAGTLITSTRMAVGKSVVYKIDVAINQDLKALYFYKSVSVEFMAYWFEFHEQLISELGSGSTVKGISIGELQRLKFNAPQYNEQVAIAQVLSDTDNEIAALEKRLEKTRMLKQGMMQELLTGRIRLV